MTKDFIGHRIRLKFNFPVCMGILNITPDSFSDGGLYQYPLLAQKKAIDMIEQGAKIIDVGGESTRPYSEGVSAKTEIDRVLPVLKKLKKLPVVLSIDTSKAQVAEVALKEGVDIVNDVSGLNDPDMTRVVSHYKAGIIIMHSRDKPLVMQKGEIKYKDLICDISDFLEKRYKRAIDSGIQKEKIILDPGIGFGKTVSHNIQLTLALHHFGKWGNPILYGPSRKNFLGKITGNPTDDRDRATAAACVIGIMKGAHIIRVHDIFAVKDAIKIAHAMKRFDFKDEKVV